MEKRKFSIQAGLAMALLLMGLAPVFVCASDDVVKKPSVQIQTRYTIAAKALRSGDYDKASQLLETMVTEEPDVAKYRYALSMAYAKQGDHAKTWQQLRQTLQLNPEHEEATRDIVMLWQTFDENGLFNVGVSIDQIQAQLGAPDHVKTNQAWQGWRYAFWLIEVVDGSVKRVLDIRKIDPKLLLFSDNVEFFVDDKHWIPGHRSGNRYYLKTDYILPSQTPQSWDQLFSSQHFLGLSGTTPLDVLLKSLQQQLFSIDPKTHWHIISADENEMIYEYETHEKIEQYTIARIMVGERDIHQLSYSAKHPQLSAQKRQHWLELLKQARLIKHSRHYVSQPDILMSFSTNPLQSPY